jgi:citrate lyase subunit beta/citryl-CoA lyase
MLSVCSLFIPASSAGMVVAGLSLHPDSLIFDLEDAVSLEEKDAARELLRYALPLFEGKNVAVRINAMDGCWEEDLQLAYNPVVKHIVVPKADAQTIAAIDSGLGKIGCDAKIAALIESPSSLENLDTIVQASPRLSALLLGGEDFCLSMGIERSVAGEEIFYARTRICSIAHANDLEVLDTPFPETDNSIDLEIDTRRAKNLGFTGKLAISPHQIATIQRIFLPTEEDLQWAQIVVAAAADPANKGKGAFSVQGKMVDLPVIKRAERALALGQSQGDWTV